MNQKINFHIPNCKEFRKGYEIYKRKEKRGFVYFEATSMISKNWGNATKMAEGISRLIRSWNRFFANFDFDELVKCLDKNMKTLNRFRNRNIASFSNKDEKIIEDLFNQFLVSLRRTLDNVESPVSVAKALNPLCQNFFPIWDSSISIAYGCLYIGGFAASPYISFCKKMKLLARKVKLCVPNPDDRSLLKRIDEYNYSKYTMFWI